MVHINIKTEKNVGLPRYCEVRDKLIQDIRSQKLRASDQIPTEVELMNEFNVSRTTVRRAIQDLVDNGILVRRQGVGTFVNAPHFTRNLLGCMSFTSDCIANGYTPRTEVLWMEHNTVSKKIAGKLHIEPDAMVYRLCRLRFINNEPVMIEFNEVPDSFDFFSRVKKEDFQSFIRLFRKNTGSNYDKYDAEVEISYATREEAELLNIREGAVIFVNESVLHDDNLKPMFTSKQIIAAEKVKLNFSVPRN